LRGRNIDTVWTELAFLNGLLFGLVLAAPVGPVGVMCVQRSITEGRLHGLLSGLGASFGDALFGAVAAFGVSSVEDWITSHQATLRMVGGIVMLVLVVRTVLSRPRERQAGNDNGAGRLRVGIHTGSLCQDFCSTFVLAIANPVTLMAFAGVLAMFGSGGASQSLGHGAWLVIGVFLGSAVWWVALSLTAGHFRGFLNGGFDRWVTRLSAAILLLFGLYALATALFLEL
jgi:threonine/homoserine/homoserine lactone efflux protein